ncbi:dihydrofolate reductase family protein [Martelella sp. FLE1502]
MRKLISGMKISLDGRVEGPDGYADWVTAWSEDYGITPHIDACLLGGGMYPGYEQYWTAMRQSPGAPLPMTGEMPTDEEVKWARLIPNIPHYVLSSTLTSALWTNTRFMRLTDEVAQLKQAAGKDIYLVGGARITATLINAGLVDEIRLIVHPLLAGSGKRLFDGLEQRRALRLLDAKPVKDDLVQLSYALIS